MPTSRATFRTLLGDAIGFGEYTALSTSAAGAANGSTIVDASLGRYPNDYFNGWWGVLPLGAGGAGSYAAFEVSDFATSTGTLTLQENASAQVATAVTFELYRYPPTMLHAALNTALRRLYPVLYNPLRNETLFANDQLLNSDFETGTFTSWTSVNSPTLAAETSRVWHGAQSASVTAGASIGRLQQSVFATAAWREWVGRSITFRRWVFATATSTARLRLTFDGGTTFTNGSYHTGDDEWQGPETMFVNTTIPANSSSITAVCEVAANGAAFFDGGAGAGLFIGGVPVYRYTVPTAFIGGPLILSVPSDPYHFESPFIPYHAWHMERAGETRYIVLHEELPDGTLLRLQGPGMLTVYGTSDTANTEVAAPHTELVVARAANILFEMLATDASGDERQEYESQAARWRVTAGELQQTLRMPRPPAELDLPWVTYGDTSAYRW